MTKVSYALRTRSDLDAIREGNRVVLTASQHAHSPSPELRTPRTYVTVAELQAGDARPVGTRDCSERPVVAHAELQNCDLVGAVLRRAQVSAEGTGTRMLRADLTGADLREADLTRADIAGGRVNGADASGAKVDRVSLAGAEARGFFAQATTIESSDFFDTDLDRARFEGSTFLGTSMARARLERAQFDGAEIVAADMKVARLVGADLHDATLQADVLYFADLTEATLRGATLVSDTVESLTAWATLCRTTLPDGSKSDRDCTEGRAPDPKPAGKPFVEVKADLDRARAGMQITGRIDWSSEGVSTYRMTRGVVRVVVIDGRTGLPTVLGTAAAIYRKAGARRGVREHLQPRDGRRQRPRRRHRDPAPAAARARRGGGAAHRAQLRHRRHGAARSGPRPRGQRRLLGPPDRNRRRAPGPAVLRPGRGGPRGRRRLALGPAHGRAHRRRPARRRARAVAPRRRPRGRGARAVTPSSPTPSSSP